MAKLVVNSESLVSVADAIREKGGTNASLEFPNGFVDGINAIESGGGGKEEQEKSVTITENGTTEILPDEGKTLSKVAVNVEVESGGGSSDTLTLLLKKELTEYQINEEIDLSEIIFRNCVSLIKFSAPLLKSVAANCFNCCNLLTYVDLGNIKSLAHNVLYGCGKLKTVVLRSSEMCTLSGKINSSSLNAGVGFFYVPRALIEEYKVATNWATYANQFRALEDYTVDGTITGALDESKI